MQIVEVKYKIHLRKCFDVCSVATGAVLGRVQNRSSNAFLHFAVTVIISKLMKS